ncbi:MAG: alanyl-tRNA editing protein [Gammaproteobacteria bacterium]
MTEELFREDSYLRHCDATVTAIQSNAVVLNCTVFYPQGGGQPGDRGVLQRQDGSRLDVVDTRKSENSIQHILADGQDPPAVGETIIASIDWARRHRLMRMHTCLHLLSSVITAPVTGGAVNDGDGRLDFDLPETPDKETVAGQLNRLITEDHEVTYRWITDAELDAQPELVKTMSVKPPRGLGKVRLVDIRNVDLQPCGGTHVARTGEIGRVIISKIEKKGRQNRRVRLKLTDG